MVKDSPGNFDEKVRESELRSDKALYPYLKAHIFGPYEGDCFAYLSEVKFQLEEYGFDMARVCDDRGNQPPSDATEDEKRSFWWEESQEFLEEGDVSVFIFLDYIFNRQYLPERARERAHSAGEDPRDINTSVVAELLYWITNIDENNSRALLLFEEGIYEEIGSLIPGLAMVEGLDYEKIPNQDCSAAADEVRQRCMNWAMNELRKELQRRYDQNHSEGP